MCIRDRPTGNLDSNSSKEIMQILKNLHGEGRTVILITHDNDIASQAKRIIKIRDGRIEHDSKAGSSAASSLEEAKGSGVTVRLQPEPAV